MTRAMPFRSPEGLQPERVLGITFALLVHAALLMLLMRPPEYNPPREDVPDKRITIVDPVLPPPPPPVRRTIEQPHAQPQPQVARQTVVQHPVVTQQPTLVSLPNDPPPVVGPTEPLIINPPPAESSLTPIVAPAPTYPHEPLYEGIGGTVELELLVGTDGRVLEARIVRSSGNRQLDNAARDTVLQKWRFQPATQGGVPVQALGRLPVVFSPDNR